MLFLSTLHDSEFKWKKKTHLNRLFFADQVGGAGSFYLFIQLFLHYHYHLLSIHSIIHLLSIYMCIYPFCIYLLIYVSILSVFIYSYMYLSFMYFFIYICIYLLRIYLLIYLSILLFVATTKHCIIYIHFLPRKREGRSDLIRWRRLNRNRREIFEMIQRSPWMFFVGT